MNNEDRLTVTRQHDRRAMAVALEVLIALEGATSERRKSIRCIHLDVTAAQGLCVSINLDGNSSQPDIYLLSWYIDSASNAELNESTFGGKVNPHHRRKATYIADGFEELYQKLQTGLQKAANGTAFIR